MGRREEEEEGGLEWAIVVVVSPTSTYPRGGLRIAGTSKILFLSSMPGTTLLLLFLPTVNSGNPLFSTLQEFIISAADSLSLQMGHAPFATSTFSGMSLLSRKR